MPLSLQEQRVLKKKSSSLGVELQPLIVVDDEGAADADTDTIMTAISYGAAPQDTDSLTSLNKADDVYSTQETSGLYHDENKPQQQPSDEHQRQVQLFRPENLAIPVCYLCVGLMQGKKLPTIRLRKSWKYPHLNTLNRSFETPLECLSARLGRVGSTTNYHRRHCHAPLYIQNYIWIHE